MGFELATSYVEGSRAFKTLLSGTAICCVFCYFLEIFPNYVRMAAASIILKSGQVLIVQHPIPLWTLM